MTKRILKKVAEQAFLAVVMIVTLAATVYGCFALMDAVSTDPSEKASTGVYTVTTTPAETTAPAAPTPEALAPVVEPDEPVQAPAPETTPAPESPDDGSLPEGWLPPSVPGGPPTAPPAALPPAPCMPGEGSERCAVNGG